MPATDLAKLLAELAAELDITRRYLRLIEEGSLSPLQTEKRVLAAAKIIRRCIRDLRNLSTS